LHAREHRLPPRAARAAEGRAIKPLRLTCRNFRTYESLDLDVSDGGLYAILGDIRDGNGTDSNGAGKSSILEAIEIALFGRRSLAPYLTRGVEDELLLELEFEHGAKMYRVRRTFSPRGRGRTTLDFECWKNAPLHSGVDTGPQWEPLTKESAKETQAEIERLIGLSRDTFRHSSYLRQQSRSFADESIEPRERKRLLTEAVLGRDPVWPRLLDRARVDKNDLNGKLLALAARTSQAQEQAAQKPTLEREHGDIVEAETVAADNVADLERAHAELAAEYQAAREHAARRAAAEAELKTAEAALVILQTRAHEATKAAYTHAEAAAELERLPAYPPVDEIRARIAVLEATVEAHREAVAAHEAAVTALKHADRERADLGNRAGALRAEADMLDARPLDDGATCIHCGQVLGYEAREQALASFRAQAAALYAEAEKIAVPVVPALPDDEPPAAELALARKTVDAIGATVAKRAVLEERITQCETAAASGPSPDQLVAAETFLLEKRDAVVAVGEPPNTDAVAARGTQVAEELARARASLDGYRQQRARLEERVAVATAAEQSIAEAATEQTRLQADLDVTVALERAYSPNGIPALILENSAIPYLETEASRILALLGCPYTVELRTQADLKSGDGVRETLDVAVIDERGQPAPFEEGTSGGEKTRIGLALRIALARLLAHRRGAQSRMLALDEPGDLDESGMAALVSVLRDLQDEFDLIFLVSHVPGLRDSFDTTLTVEKQDGVSRIVEAGVFEAVPA
jgi:DNA repair protein SbcC/Rad50